jgi:hypothetical protein
VFDEEAGTEINWYRNGLVIDALAGESEVPAVMTAKGDLWFFTVTPGDGKHQGEAAPAPPVEITNSPPVASDLTITPAEPTPDFEMRAGYTYTDTDGDAESGTTLMWYRNNEAMEELSDELVVPQNMLVTGDIWYFTVQPGDGDGFGKIASADTVTIGKPAVAVEMALVTPEQPLTTDDLGAYIELSEMKDSFTFEYRWYKNNEVQAVFNDLDSIEAKHTSKGEVWYYTIRVNTGVSWTNAVRSSTVTIVNSIPVVEDILISPESPTSSMELSLSYAFNDADADAEAETEIRWYRNGEGVKALNDQKRVPVDYLLSGDEWYATLLPNDGEAAGLLVTSKIVTINIPPITTDLELFPANPEPIEPLTLYYTYFDENNDGEALTAIHWYRNGMHVSDYDNWKAVPADATTEGDEWYVVITPHDGKEFGLEYKSNSVTINGASDTTEVQEVKDDAGLSLMSILSIVFIILICVFIIMFLVIRRSKVLRSTTKESVDQIFTIEAAEALTEGRKTENVRSEPYTAEPVISREYFGEAEPQAPRYVDSGYVLGIEGADPCQGCDSETYGDLQRCASCFNEIDEFNIEED